MSKLPFIDALRGFAFLGVLVSHAARNIEFWGFLGQDVHLTPWVYTLSEQGARGVQLFFVISAFTLCLAYERRRQETRPLLNFFIRRFFRIAPLFYTALVVYTILPTILFSNEWPSLGHMISTITFTNGLNPYWINAANALVPGGWSIAVEMTFYILFPYLFSRINSLKKAIVLTALTIFISQALFLLLKRHPMADKNIWDIFISLWFPNQLAIFLLGFILFFLYRKIYFSSINTNLEFKSNSHKIRNNGNIINIILAICIAFLFIMPFQKSIFFPFHFFYGLDFLLISVCLIFSPSNLIVNRWMCYLGTLSFSAYISHFYVLEIVNKALHLLNFVFLPPDLYLVLLIFLGLLGTIIASKLSYEYIELPGIELGRKLIENLEASKLKFSLNSFFVKGFQKR
jgi:peptidoglycan/LPS O-acetylase OafA/YrhL